MRRCNNFLLCVAITLFLSCLVFGTTVAKSTIAAKPSNKEKASTPIAMQQKTISDGLKRIEKKLLKEERKSNAN
jgi:peptidoglycan hydrolase CwlO-like protein